jgi:hypothetical protein
VRTLLLVAILGATILGASGAQFNIGGTCPIILNNESVESEHSRKFGYSFSVFLKNVIVFNSTVDISNFCSVDHVDQINAVDTLIVSSHSSAWPNDAFGVAHEVFSESRDGRRVFGPVRIDELGRDAYFGIYSRSSAAVFPIKYDSNRSPDRDAVHRIIFCVSCIKFLEAHPSALHMGCLFSGCCASLSRNGGVPTYVYGRQHVFSLVSSDSDHTPSHPPQCECKKSDSDARQSVNGGFILRKEGAERESINATSGAIFIGGLICLAPIFSWVLVAIAREKRRFPDDEANKRDHE